MKLKWYKEKGDRQCMFCKNCVATCPANALHFEDWKTDPKLIWDKDKCIGCMKCINICPEQVLQKV